MQDGPIGLPPSLSSPATALWPQGSILSRPREEYETNLTDAQSGSPLPQSDFFKGFYIERDNGDKLCLNRIHRRY